MIGFLETAQRVLWGPGAMALLLGTGLFLTLRTNFLPWRNLGWSIRTALGRDARRGTGVSPFSALMTALAATIGTGNIVGVATALAAGGPGALVWMELSALLGLSTKCVECLLSVKYRRRDRRGEFTGGPMYVMESALGRPGRIMGAVFAAAAVCSSLGVGGMVQSQSAASALETAFGFPAGLTGLAAAALALAALLRGSRGVAKACERLVPAMAVFYFLCALTVILGNWRNLPGAAAEIFRCAFAPRAAAGGAAGTAVSMLDAARWGVARGVFSNEAGTGAAGIAAASADGGSPARQGYINMAGVFFDTMILCTATGLAICASGVLEEGGGTGGTLTVRAFATVLGPWAPGLIGVSLALFAFSTVLGWAYQGERAFAYLSGGRGLGFYRTAMALAVLAGAGAGLEPVFLLADICGALMCFPNLLCLLALSGEAARELRSFQRANRRRSSRLWAGRGKGIVNQL